MTHPRRALVCAAVAAALGTAALPAGALARDHLRDTARPPHPFRPASDTPAFPASLEPAPLAHSHAQRARDTATDLARTLARRRPDAALAFDHADRRLDDALRGTGRWAPIRPPFPERRGRLPWPVQNPRVAAPFGDRKRPDSPTLNRHTGLSLAVAEGAEIQAVAPGVVLFADFVEGLGGVVVLAHDPAWSTVYAGLVVLERQPLDLVDAGTPIGRGGHLNAWGTRELYFEVRDEGVPIDPLPWLRPLPTRTSSRDYPPPCREPLAHAPSGSTCEPSPDTSSPS